MASFTDPSWIRPHLPCSEDEKQAAIIAFENLVANGGGLSGAGLRRVLVSWPETEKPSQSYIFKIALEDTLERSKSLGNAREAIFYDTLAKTLANATVPTAQVIYSEGNMETGVRILVMEDLGTRGIQSGLLFGRHSPLNWQVDVAAAVARLPKVHTAFEVAAKTFVEAAKMHRVFWKDETLLGTSWLRCSDWLRGENKDSWTAAQDRAVDCWKRTQEKIAAGSCTVKWDANLLECIEQALRNIDWDDYQAQLQAREWTLVHGDFHPANVMWMIGEESREDYPLLLDWEMVGLGSGPQEIAQYLISHMPPADRRDCEDALLHIYYDALVNPEHAGNASLTAESYPFEVCKRHYVEGGAARWVWFTPLLATMCPDVMTQYFQDQTAAFLTDHGVTKETIGCPRV